MRIYLSNVTDQETVENSTNKGLFIALSFFAPLDLACCELRLYFIHRHHVLRCAFSTHAQQTLKLRGHMLPVLYSTRHL